MSDQLRVTDTYEFLKQLPSERQEEYISHLDPRKLVYLVIRILIQSPPSSRNDLEIKVIDGYLKGIDFFQDAEDKVRLRCANLLKYRLLPEKENVFKRGTIKSAKSNTGDAGQHFYIILEGSVGVYVVVTDQDEEVEVNQLHAGSHFGEQALIKDAPRNATIKCLTPCHLGELEKTSYNETLGNTVDLIKTQEARLAEKMARKVMFLRSLPLLCKFRPGTIRTLIQHFKVGLKFRGNVLCREGQQSHSVFIVKKGELKITKCLSLPRNLQPFVIAEKHNQLKQLLVTKSFEIARIASGEIYGEIDCLLNEPYHFTLICTSQTAKIYEIASNDFLQRILTHNRSAEIKEFIQKYISEKISYRNKHILDVVQTLKGKVPLLSGVHKDSSVMPYKKPPLPPPPPERPRTRSRSDHDYYSHMVRKKSHILRQLSQKNYTEQKTSQKQEEQPYPIPPPQFPIHRKLASYASAVNSSSSTLFITNFKPSRSNSIKNQRIVKIKSKLNTSIA